MTDLETALQALARGAVDFIIVGGVAATIHGSTRLTRDLDIVYARAPENIARLATAMAPYHPYLRGAPPGLPFRWDAETIRRGLNFTLTTTLGDLDLLGEIVGGGAYEDVLPHTQPVAAFGVTARCVNLPRLIHLKRTAGRPRDLEAIAELEALREQDRGEGVT